MAALGVKPQRPPHGAGRMREQRARTAWRIVVDQIKGGVVLPPSATLAAAVFGRQIDAQDLVPGGIVLLEVNPLQCDETALTEVLQRS